MEPTRHRSILLVADPYLPVPPVHYGGVERIVGMLAEGLQARGWNVTLFCHPDSKCPVTIVPMPLREPDAISRLRNSAKVMLNAVTHRYDIIHSFAHFDLTAGFWPTSRRQIQSFQAPPHPESFAKRIKLLPRKNVWFTTCGHHMVEGYQHFAPTRGIHNGVITSDFVFQQAVAEDAPFIFLGRIEPIKGTHLAIDIAEAVGRKLVIAGNQSTSTELTNYFKEKIQPRLSDQVTYVGPVNDREKSKLLGAAAALLMPIQWDEPFGIVMAEALACGTPVIGTNRGALPEIVRHGLTGFQCESVEEMIQAARLTTELSREACRLAAETRFSSEMIIDQYVALYEEILNLNDTTAA